MNTQINIFKIKNLGSEYSEGLYNNKYGTSLIAYYCVDNKIRSVNGTVVGCWING